MAAGEPQVYLWLRTIQRKVVPTTDAGRESGSFGNACDHRGRQTMFHAGIFPGWHAVR